MFDLDLQDAWQLWKCVVVAFGPSGPVPASNASSFSPWRSCQPNRDLPCIKQAPVVAAVTFEQQALIQVPNPRADEAIVVRTDGRAQTFAPQFAPTRRGRCRNRPETQPRRARNTGP